MSDIVAHSSQDGCEPHVEAAKSGERRQDRNEPDSFPPEGTDEKLVRPDNATEKPFSDEEATQATQAVVARGPSGEGETSDVLSSHTDPLKSSVTDSHRLQEDQNLAPGAKGNTGQVWAQDYNPDPSHAYLHPGPESNPANLPHDRGSDTDSRNAQYGASPVREARYADVARNLEENAASPGKRSTHSGAEARLPKANESDSKPDE